MGPRTLRSACQAGDLPLVKEFIAKGSDVNEVVPSSGWFPLGGAVNRGHLKIVKELLAAGADPKMRTKCNWSLLYIAVWKPNYRIAKLLLSVGVGTETRTILGYNSPDKFTPLHLAASKGNLRMCKLLIEGGASINSIDGGGHTPTGRAILSKRYKTALWLVLNGGKTTTELKNKLN